MKSYVKVALATVMIGAGVWIGAVYSNTAVGSGTSQPGTADDPVVTKSYVDQQIQKALGGGSSTTPTKPTEPSPSVVEEVKVVNLKPGKILFAKAGTEFIVRSGKAVIYTESKDGVADLTDGMDLVNGQAAPTNHLLSFPRDGRGITVKEGIESGLVVMVRGGYQIK